MQKGARFPENCVYVPPPEAAIHVPKERSSRSRKKLTTSHCDTSTMNASAMGVIDKQAARVALANFLADVRWSGPWKSLGDGHLRRGWVLRDAARRNDACSALDFAVGPE